MPVELSDAFRQVLRSYRKQKDWSQMKLAIEAEMHLNALGSLERGLYSPSLQTVFQLCKALDVSMAEFLSEIETLIFADTQQVKKQKGSYSASRGGMSKRHSIVRHRSGRGGGINTP